MNCKLTLLALANLLLSVACTPANDSFDYKITIELILNDNVLKCDKASDKLFRSHKVDQVGLFLSDITVKRKDISTPVMLHDSPWQSDNVVLVYLSGDCNRDRNLQLTFSAPFDVSAADSLSFILGVPFHLNHQNPMTQASPLNLPSMFWTWQTGHKFLRLDMANNQANPGQSFAFHLGSVGCSSVSRVRSPSEPCASPNTFNYALPKTKMGKTLRIDLDELLEGVTPSAQSSCLFHGKQEASCQHLLENLYKQQVFTWI